MSLDSTAGPLAGGEAAAASDAELWIFTWITPDREPVAGSRGLSHKALLPVLLSHLRASTTERG